MGSCQRARPKPPSRARHDGTSPPQLYGGGQHTRESTVVSAAAAIGAREVVSANVAVRASRESSFFGPGRSKQLSS